MLQYALFSEMKGSSLPGIDGFTMKWLRKFWSNLKMVTLNAINESYRNGSLSTNLKTGNQRSFEERAKDPTLTRNYRPISLLLLHVALLSIFDRGYVQTVILHTFFHKVITMALILF